MRGVTGSSTGSATLAGTDHQPGWIQVLDGGVMEFRRPEFALSRHTQIGMVLAATFDGWEDHDASRSR
ncbi:MAG TPA: hypothetical protein VFT66_24470 [Roseiflexaceae bacterium]|jgi:hypothetical protein|nr:hypothetical protein [Roseiflexaceae bacterium]